MRGDSPVLMLTRAQRRFVRTGEGLSGQKPSAPYEQHLMKNLRALLEQTANDFEDLLNNKELSEKLRYEVDRVRRVFLPRDKLLEVMTPAQIEAMKSEPPVVFEE